MMKRTMILGIGLVVAAPVLGGCEAMIPLVLAAEGGGSAGIPDYGDDAYYGYDMVDLEVELVDLEGRFGGRALAPDGVQAEGYSYGTSTAFVLSTDVDPGDVQDIEIYADLCPIEDVMLNGDATTAFLALNVCVDGWCQDATWSLEADVEEDGLGARTVRLASVLEDGEPLRLTLRYTTPE